MSLISMLPTCVFLHNNYMIDRVNFNYYKHEKVTAEKISHLVTKSSVPLVRSMSPPVGLTMSPTSPFPVPLKNPATPSFCAPGSTGEIVEEARI